MPDSPNKLAQFWQELVLASFLLVSYPVSSQELVTDNKQNPDIQRFQKYTYVYQQGTGIEAFSFLMPSDWVFEGGIRWILDNPGMPAVSEFRVFNPDGKEQFEARGEVYDKVSQKFSDNTLGIDRYYDPFEEREVELPSGYNHAWSNNNGEYILSDSPSFNPNIGSNLHWEPLRRQ